ncbi:MAG TPA: LacI family DNA-binding transcriptional regulator [Blastocatellia bacterium]|nr:LacI family DNA-binding transcriptional regulator [Blastocatellia bacterium]
MGQVSIKDIARAAQVSHPTVSRALRNSPLVNSATAERIRRIAVRMGYRPSAVARSLVTKRTRTIGVVVTTIADPFIAEVVGGIEEAANEQGYSVVLANSNADPDRELKVVHSIHERRVDGIIVTSSRVGALYVPVLSQLMAPIVLINNQHPDDSDFVYSVMIDNVTASRTAMQHLLELGHRRIAYIGDQAGFQSDTERFAGYRQALALAGCPFRPELVAHGNGKPEGGRQAMTKLLALDEMPTAVFCYNDMSALGALRAIDEHGLKVPADISVVGFDDVFFASWMRPLLTTIRQPKRQMGRLAMETLLRIFAGEQAGTSIKVNGELVVRESTAPPERKQKAGDRLCRQAANCSSDRRRSPVVRAKR